MPQRRNNLIVFPYANLRYEDSNVTGVENSWKPNAGIDVKYNITSNLAANLSVNPDFATVEGDQDQINMTRWELSFPEKRLFFLDGNDQFSTRIKTFYSRRIGDINYGAKLSGKVGNTQMNLISARTVANPDNNDPASFFTAARFKRDFLKSSTLGMTLVDKRWDGGSTQSFSGDIVLNPGKIWKITGQLVASLPGDFNSHSAYFMRFARENNNFHYHVRYSYFGENFRDNVNQTGFIRVDDKREIDSDVDYKWWFDNKFVKYFKLSTANNVYWDTKGTFLSWYITEKATLYLKNRFSLDLSYNDEYKLFEKKYYNHKYGITLGYNTDEWASAHVQYQWGRNFDRDFELLQGNIKIKPGNKLALQYTFNKVDYNPDPDNNSTILNILSADYNFTKDIWIRVFAQNNTVNDKVYVYSLFGWRFKPPFGAVYLIFNSDNYDDPLANLYGMQQINERKRSNVLFIKLTYPLELIK
ncbi:DUF5916 domain-containing protein [Bacteroidota bacterium]